MALPSLHALTEHVRRLLPHRPRLAAMFESCLTSTLETTVRPQSDGTTFVITGDIPAMWLRDSAAQVRPYLLLAPSDPAASDLIAGVVRRQVEYVLHDPYANAFNETASGARWEDDQTEMSDLVWERKYEVDSLCAVLHLAFQLWRATGRTDHLDTRFRAAAALILEVWRREQRHEAESPYRFVRTAWQERGQLPRGGLGSPIAETGMTWSGFRPSDDACRYGYLVPSNMYAVVVLGHLERLADEVLDDLDLLREARSLAASIQAGLDAHAKVEHPEFGTIYAYEVDGLGNYLLMDDANVPSLLSLPYLGSCAQDDPLYLNTRRFVLSRANPYFYSGRAAAGVGSPHTPTGYVWPIALAIQGLTATDDVERLEMLRLLETTDAGTLWMHESFSADDPRRFTRPWFSWANAMLCELVLHGCGITVPGAALEAISAPLLEQVNA
ncbi:glycoside hydrolase family 125 protein [Deinococcus planocerae]|uniref:glycoside hydrolase family 125 protein n=1 Tax=Deinococcus planocerae TaxID=1737569 RepID=UPI000C7F22CD|nr:glycoside hydrolase family 125 protein [Deinococcus planocerae]